MTYDKRVLILFEGKTDQRYFTSIESMGTFSSLLKQGDYTPMLLKTSIYELYGPLIENREYDSLPAYLWRKGLLECLKDTRPQDMFSLIYLVFDFDPLYHLYAPEKILALREHFSDETKEGLLYINYPMVESILDVEKTQDGYRVKRQRPLELCSSDSYKSIVRKETPLRSPSGHPYRFLPAKEFAKVSYASLFRYREITGTKGPWVFSDGKTLLQKEIAARDSGLVLPLSCLPFMALDYNAEEAIKEWDAAKDDVDQSANKAH